MGPTPRRTPGQGRIYRRNARRLEPLCAIAADAWHRQGAGGEKESTSDGRGARALPTAPREAVRGGDPGVGTKRGLRSCPRIGGKPHPQAGGSPAAGVRFPPHRRMLRHLRQEALQHCGQELVAEGNGGRLRLHQELNRGAQEHRESLRPPRVPGGGGVDRLGRSTTPPQPPTSVAWPCRATQVGESITVRTRRRYTKAPGVERASCRSRLRDDDPDRP